MKTRSPAFNDQLLSQYCSLIEQLILSADETAVAEGIRLTDSAIKSALVKAVNTLRNRPPKQESANSQKDILLRNLSGTFLGLRMQLEAKRADAAEGEPGIKPPPDQWITVLTGVVQSIETRMSGEAGGRAYLDFLPGFFKSVQRQIAFKGASASLSEAASQPVA